MPGFLFRLNPPRPTFPADITDDEMATMISHVEYWTALAADGIAIAFGPVADPERGYGIGVILADDLAHAERLRDDDPAMQAPHGFTTDILPMPSLVTQAGRFDA